MSLNSLKVDICSSIFYCRTISQLSYTLSYTLNSLVYLKSNSRMWFKNERQETTWMQNNSPDNASGENVTAESERIDRSDGNEEHIVKPDSIQSSSNSHSYRLIRLKTENQKLKYSMRCSRRCHSIQVQTLILPCRHIRCCEACADNCPLCTDRILITVLCAQTEYLEQWEYIWDKILHKLHVYADS